MKIHQITFSHTGGTRRASEYICEGSDTRPIVTDLCVKEGQIRLPDIHEEDWVIIAMPMFAGCVPALAVKRRKHIQSYHAKCAVVAVQATGHTMTLCSKCRTWQRIWDMASSRSPASPQAPR